MPPPYLVDIDGHPHPLKGQNVVLDIIRPSSSLKANKQEEPEALVDYDEFMKQRQAQLSHGNMRINMSSSLRLNNSDNVYENNRDTCNHVDKPCNGGINSGQCSSKSQESETIDQISNSVLIDNNSINTKTTNGDLHSELTRNGRESNGITQNHSEESGSIDDLSIHDNQRKYSVTDHEHLTNQLLTSGQQSSNDQQVMNGQEIAQVFNGQQSSSSHQPAINNQEQSQETVNNQQTINGSQSIAAILNNSNDDINIMEFDSADQPAGTSSNNNILTSIVWSCGLSDQEAKNAVSLWLSRTIVPEIDPDIFG